MRISTPAPASSRNDAVICVTAKMRRRRLLLPVLLRVPPTVRLALIARASARAGAGMNARKTAATKRQGDAEPDERGVEREAVGADGEARGVVAEDGDHGRGEEQRGDDAASAEDEAFGEERAAQGCGAGAECGADGEFGFAADGAGEDQVGDVGAGDDEQQPGGGEEHPEDGVGARVDLVVHARNADMVVVVGLVDLGMRLIIAA